MGPETAAMSTSHLSRLVQAMCWHFARDGPTLEASIAPPQYFATAVIAADQSFCMIMDTDASATGMGATRNQTTTTATLSEATRQELETLMKELEEAVASPTLPCSSASLCSFVALVLMTWRRTNTAGRQYLRHMAQRFMACALTIWKSQPPFPAESQTAASYCAAQLIVRGGCCDAAGHVDGVGLCEELVEEATRVLATLRGRGRPSSQHANPKCTADRDAPSMTTTPLPSASAVELIAECTALLVASRPPQLEAEAVNPQVMAGKASNSRADGGGGKWAGDGTGKRNSRRAAHEGKIAGSREGAIGNGYGGGSTSDSNDKGSKPNPECTVPTDAASGAAALLPTPSAATIARFQHRFIECCLSALGGGLARQDTSTYSRDTAITATSKDGGLTGTGDEDSAALLCRRILIPLLLLGRSGGSEYGGRECAVSASMGLAHYERRIHELLLTLGSAETGDVATDCRRRSEAIVMVAALFDVLFHSTSENGARSSLSSCDFRTSPFFWSLLRKSFWDAATCTELDAGRRATMQLRSEYLLKRVVDLCRKETLSKPSGQTAVAYHDWFVWSPGCEASWELFFLFLGAVGEFGVHIVIPAMTPLDALVRRLQTQLESAVTPPVGAAASLHACWVELLFLKLSQHPNLGVRKLGLRRLWSLPDSVLGSFSPSFLYGYAFRSTADPRLCTDLDRLPPPPAAFLEVASVEADEDKAVPNMEPIAESVEQFYARLFSAHLRSAASRTQAMGLLCEFATQKPSRFTIVVLMRLLCHLARTLYAEAQQQGDVSTHSEATAIKVLPSSVAGMVDGPQAWTIAMALDPSFIRALTTLVRDTIQENTALWLDVRVVAMIFEALVHLAALDPARFRRSDDFWQLLCLCGPLGQSGGAQHDACGTYGANGAVGASIDPRLLQVRLVSISRELAKQACASHSGNEGSHRNEGKQTLAMNPHSLVHCLLQPETLEARTAELLDAASSGQMDTFSEATVKAHFFLVGSLLLTGEAADRAVVIAVARRVAAAAAGYHTRMYGREVGFLAAIASLVEVSRSVGGARIGACVGLGVSGTTILAEHVTAVVPPEEQGEWNDDDNEKLFTLSMAAEMAAAVYAWARRALEEGFAAAKVVASRSQQHSSYPHTSAGFYSGEAEGSLDDPACSILHTSRWDVLAAAAMRLNQMAVELDSVSGAAALQTAELVEWLVAFLDRCAESFGGRAAAAVASTASGSNCDGVGFAANGYSSVIVARDASRLLQSVLCGLVYVPTAAVPTSQVALPPYLAPLLQEAGGVGCFLNSMSSSTAADTIATLTGVLAQRQTAGAASTSWLSGQSSSVTLAEHFRYVYNAIAVLCQRVTEPRCVRRTALLLQEFGLQHVEQCWASNLTCVYDVLLWVVSTPDSVSSHTEKDSDGMAGVDREGIVRVIFDHMGDVSARQHARACALAFHSLQHLYATNPGFVVDRLLSALDADPESDRVAYFSAVAGSLLVLRALTVSSHTPSSALEHDRKRSPSANGTSFNAAVVAAQQLTEEGRRAWTQLSPVLLRVAIMYNASRDEEESESCAAAAEPVMALWPTALRVLYPPTVRLATVGRALALATILRCCALDRVTPSASSSGGMTIVQPLCLQLLEMNTTDPVVSREPCMPNSRTHRVRIRLWQLLNLLLLYLPREQVAVELVLDALLTHCVPTTNMGSVRRYIDLFAIRLLERQPSLHRKLAEAMADYTLRPQVLGTYILVACHALLHDEQAFANGSSSDSSQRRLSEASSSPGAEERTTERGDHELFDRLFPLVLRQCTSHQHLLRVISHIGVYRLCRARLAHGKRLPPEVAALYTYITEAPEHAKFRAKYEDALFYNTDEAATPRSILCVIRREANAVLRESVPAAAFERLRLVETEMCCLMGATYPIERLRAHLVGRLNALPGNTSNDDGCSGVENQSSPPINATQLLAVFRDAPYIPHTAFSAAHYVQYTADAARCLMTDPQTVAGGGGAAAHDGASDAQDNIQRKIAPWWGTEVYNELHPRALYSVASAASRRQRLIVVGSLLLNPVNIAGLCRCGEIFAVEQIIIPEKKVFEHPHFVATARSAELWIPWAEVPPRHLPAYLNERRQEGYTICGIEQTANSVSIASYEFPEKAVVVLGSEGQGIPAPLIPMLDVCIEIPQYGLIRSLNVHVAGAIVMYEHTKQRLMSKDA